LEGEGVVTKDSLSTPQQRLLETFQRTNYGRIEGLAVRGGQPQFDPPPRIVKDVKLGAPDNGTRPELQSGNFGLKREHLELFELLKRVGDGTIECIEIKGGLPFRLMVEQQA
jgi:hypothetical protein